MSEKLFCQLPNSNAEFPRHSDSKKVHVAGGFLFFFLFIFMKQLEELKDVSKGCVTKTKYCILTNGVFSSSNEVMTG